MTEAETAGNTEHSEGYLPFEEFRKLIGASPQMTRAALLALDFRGRPLPSDMRRIGYDRAWVEPVKKWIAEKTRGG